VQLKGPNLATRKKKEASGAVEKIEVAEPRHIQSIPLGFRLVKCIEAASSPLTLKEIAAAVDMDTGHAHLYLTSFKMIGLVQQAGSGGAYTLGRYAVQMGLSALRKLDIVEEARDLMLALQHETGLTAYLSVWGNLGPTIVSKVDGSFPFPMSIRVGYVLAIQNTATGCVFISYLPPRATQQLIEQEARTMLGANGARLDASPKALDKLVTQIRSQGIAQTGSAINAGFAGMSSPVFDHEGNICAALSMLGPTGAFDVRLDAPPARALKRSALVLSANLGYSTERGVGPKPVFVLERAAAPRGHAQGVL
jgi:DNA-binding IclR family transcriptional regulator